MAACRSGSSQALSQHLEDVIKFCSEQEFVQGKASVFMLTCDDMTLFSGGDWLGDIDRRIHLC